MHPRGAGRHLDAYQDKEHFEVFWEVLASLGLSPEPQIHSLLLDGGYSPMGRLKTLLMI